jgi:hypothetical protein
MPSFGTRPPPHSFHRHLDLFHLLNLSLLVTPRWFPSRYLCQRRLFELFRLCVPSHRADCQEFLRARALLLGRTPFAGRGVLVPPTSMTSPADDAPPLETAQTNMNAPLMQLAVLGALALTKEATVQLVHSTIRKA